MSNEVDNAALDAAIIAAESGAGILAELERFLSRFVAYPSEHARIAHALWIAHSHRMDAWHTTPRLAFMSAEKEAGKTRALEATELRVPAVSFRSASRRQRWCAAWQKAAQPSSTTRSMACSERRRGRKQTSTCGLSSMAGIAEGRRFIAASP